MSVAIAGSARGTGHTTKCGLLHGKSRRAREDYDKLTKMFPESLQGRSVRFIIADMSHPVVELQDGAYDLAYCERVLYHMMPNLQRIQNAINEMARVVRPGGIIIAADEHITSSPAHQQGVPIDISALFEQAGLIRSSLPTIPPHTYCYMRVVDPLTMFNSVPSAG